MGSEMCIRDRYVFPPMSRMVDSSGASTVNTITIPTVVVVPSTMRTAHNLPPINNYPLGVLLTQDEWTLGREFWYRLRSSHVSRIVNGVSVTLRISDQFLDEHERFYEGFLRTQLRRREKEWIITQRADEPSWTGVNLINIPSADEFSRVSAFWADPQQNYAQTRVDYPYNYSMSNV